MALLLLPTACGSDEAALDLDPVASAATLTSDAGSARIAFEMTMKVQGRNIELDGDGRFDFDDSPGMLTMDASSLLPEGSGHVRLEMRMLGSMIYMRLPAALGGQGLPRGKPWIAIDIEKTLKAAGIGSIDPTNLQQDPTTHAGEGEGEDRSRAVRDDPDDGLLRLRRRRGRPRASRFAGRRPEPVRRPVARSSMTRTRT